MSEKQRKFLNDLILNLNSGNLRYSIIPQLGRNYTNLSQVTIGITDEIIVENNYNQGSYVRITDEQLIKNIIYWTKKQFLTRCLQKKL